MKTILIADDDRLLRRMLVRALEKTGRELNVLEADDGEEAIDLIAKNPVDLVITDIGMPRANGLIVLAYLNAFRPDAPVFVMTAYGTARLRAKLPPDLLRFYQKPFDVQDMARSAVAVIEREADPTLCRGVNLVHMLDLADLEGVSCTIHVTGPSDQTCRLFIREGRLVDALMDDLHGEAAAVEALTWGRAKYCIEYDLPDRVENRIRASLDDLMRSVADCETRSRG